MTLSQQLLRQIHKPLAYRNKLRSLTSPSKKGTKTVLLKEREKEKVIQVKTVTKAIALIIKLLDVFARAGPLPKAIQNRIFSSIRVQEFKENNLMFSFRESLKTHLGTNA
uniref:Uncharacterized protein n=1 Tax=Glossina austeni TaxID=7395 RepID=A0A1A9UVI0_GLOAU